MDKIINEHQLNAIIEMQLSRSVQYAKVIMLQDTYVCSFRSVPSQSLLIKCYKMQSRCLLRNLLIMSGSIRMKRIIFHLHNRDQLSSNCNNRLLEMLKHAPVTLDWLQSLKQFFFNLILCLGASLIYILIASLILMALF